MHFHVASNVRPPRPFAAIALALSFTAAAASAQDTPAVRVQSAAAQALFEEGRRLLQENLISEACTKFAESQQLEPATGTLLNLALCHEQEGKTATAWLEYNDALALAAHDGDSDRKAIARARIDAIESSLSRLTLTLPAHPPSDLWVELDGVRLPPAAWRTGMPVDPGPHVVRIGAERKTTIQFSIEVPVASHITSALPELRELKPNPSRTSASAIAPVGAIPVRSARLIAVGGLFGLGLGSTAAATYAGVRAANAWHERNDHCRSGCDPYAVAAGREAKRNASVSTIATATAIASFGAAAVLYFLFPARGHETDATPKLSATITPFGVHLTAIRKF